MPLRRIPGLGSATLKALTPCLQEYGDAQRNGDFWICRDLLRVPRAAIVSCLSERPSLRASSGRQCDLLLSRCAGTDPAPIEDDGGAPPATVSVEDSFVRGSVTSMDAVRRALDELLPRLLRLLDRRRGGDTAAAAPSRPAALLLTVREVDLTAAAGRRRPFRTRSKQGALDGGGGDDAARLAVVGRTVEPLLAALLGGPGGIDVTRLNLAALSFADAGTPAQRTTPASQLPVSHYFSRGDVGAAPGPAQKPSGREKAGEDRDGSAGGARKRTVGENVKALGGGAVPPSPAPPPGVDPSVFAALPPDIAREVAEQNLPRHYVAAARGRKKPRGHRQLFPQKVM